MSGPDLRMDILVIDDDPKIRSTLETYLKDRGHRVSLAADGEAGLACLRSRPADIAIVDVRMPGMDGFEVLQEARQISPGTDVIIITGYREIENAFRAMREGAFDFFTKPLKVQELSASLQRTTRFRALRREKDRVQERLERLDKEVRLRFGASEILGNSPAIQSVRSQILQVAQTHNTAVLIYGETGTGKELAARAVHAESARAGGPFVAVNCSALPESLVQSAFYGHEKGAFTDARESRKGYFEMADGGTLFLDEIGDMPLGMQMSLLRTLEERLVRRLGGAEEIPVNIRVVSATNRDLPQAVSRGGFRADLLYRLNTVSIRIPPLRERPEDILCLAEHFLHRYAEEMRKPVHDFTPEAAVRLNAHPFPGNVRELKNMLERAVIFCQDDHVTPEDLGLPDQMRRSDSLPGGDDAPVAADFSQIPDLTLAAFEAGLIREALRRSKGNLSRTARLLGISREMLRTRMRHHGLSADVPQDCPTD